MTTRLEIVHLSDFTGGLVTSRPPSEIAANQSPELDNVFITDKGFFSRTGDSAFCTAMNSGANVQGLTEWSTSGGSNFLVAVCGSKLYKSDNFDGTMDDITGSLTITGGQNNIFTFSSLNDLLIGVGGAPNAPFKWSGTGNGAALGGSPVSGKFGFQMRDRMFICAPTANPSTVYWSVLANPEDWSGTGSGNTTVVTNDGDILTGGVAVNNSLALLFKNYSIHQMTVDTAPFPVKPLSQAGVGACGKNAIVVAEGLVYFITNSLRMKATDGYNIIDFPDTIDDLWDATNRARIAYIFGKYVPNLRQIHWYVSMGTATANDYCIVWDLENKCWLRYTTGFDCNVACVAQGYRLFGGHTNGIIYEKFKSGVYTDASESSAAVSSYFTTPWFNNVNNMKIKQMRYVDVNYDAQSGGVMNVSYGYDFTQGIDTHNVSMITSGSTWDGTGTWDGTAVWGGTNERKQYRFWVQGTRGNVFQLKIANSTAYLMKVNSIDIAVKEQGVKEMSVR